MEMNLPRGVWTLAQRSMKFQLTMTSIPANVIAIEKRGDQYQVIVQIHTKYRGSFNTLAFGEIKPYSGSLKDGRLDGARSRNGL
jgi:hypothetical protein